MGIFGGKFTNLNTNISNKENQEANCIHPKYYAEKIWNHSEVQAKGKGTMFIYIICHCWAVIQTYFYELKTEAAQSINKIIINN